MPKRTEMTEPWRKIALWLEHTWGQDYLRIATWLTEAENSPGTEKQWKLNGMYEGDVYVKALKDGRFIVRVDARPPATGPVSIAPGGRRLALARTAPDAAGPRSGLAS